MAQRALNGYIIDVSIRDLAADPRNWYRGSVMSATSDSMQLGGVGQLALDHALPAVSEESLFVQELQAGSEEAFSYLLKLYQDTVFNLVAHIVENHTDAADVLQ